MTDSVWRFCLSGIVLVLVACSPSRAPVVDYSRDSGDIDTRGARVTEGVHEVRDGETLYSIAWRYGWDFRKLARANDIEPPYTIYPGQKIHLDASATRTDSTASSSSASAARETSASGAEPESSSKPDKSASESGDTEADTGRKELPSGTPDWQWPAEGELVGRFDDDGMSGRGIILAGREGAPVRAAGAGRVVYRGNGLTGYGNLLIIKHNSQWLSAYAHNRRMLVQEGAAVDAGQRIATMGASGTYRTQLHFEIRRDGEPVDPEPLLPKR
jgi:lipoprotein NlpD